jgi:hypothetical protein
MKQLLSAVLMLTFALPANAASIIHGPESFTVNRNTPYTTTVSAQQYEALILSFSYDSSALDLKSSVQDDTFTYGIAIDGIETVLGEIKGLIGVDPAEFGTVSVVLPNTVSESEFTVFARVAANTDSDIVSITNLEVNGELAWDGVLNTPETAFQKAGGLVTICHFDDDTEQFYKETLNIASIIKGKGHGQHGDDIIPLFWYMESRGADIALYGGNDWNKTSKALYLNDCVEGE